MTECNSLIKVVVKLGWVSGEFYNCPTVKCCERCWLDCCYLRNFHNLSLNGWDGNFAAVCFSLRFKFTPKKQKVNGFAATAIPLSAPHCLFESKEKFSTNFLSAQTEPFPQLNIAQ